MKVVKFLLSFIITIALTVALSIKIQSIPPLGKFLDPFHGFWQNAETLIPEGSPSLALEMLEAPVSVHYDSLLIPHIFAENETDLYRVQGYVMAQHRLWQMEFVTHVAAGRVSEIIGERALEFDRMQRRKGLAYGAENSLQALMKTTLGQVQLEAYAAGVNAYINKLTYDQLPIEYKILEYRPESWTPLKTALLLKYMADDLSGSDSDLENTNALKFLGKERFDFLFPSRSMDAEPVIPPSKKWEFKAAPLDTPKVVIADTSEFIMQVMDQPDPDNGSNNWAVAGSKTRSGKPMLANDPHLGLNLPSIWYAMQLNAPGVNVMGVTLPGAPNIIIGFNDSIAWGVTNARRDVKDWYKIHFTDASLDEYYYDNNKLKTQKRVEEIKVRDGTTVFDTVTYTHFGPVVFDSSFPADSVNNNKRGFAMKWTALDASSELLAFYYLNRADNHAEYVQALKYYESPAQNFVFASAAGDIAMWVQGKFPAKWREQGKFLMDGSTSELEWKSIIPNNHNPQVLNPERGFVSSANQIPVAQNYPYYVYDDTYEHYRNRRINERLGKMRNIMPKDFMDLQNDTYNLMAAESLPLMLDTLDIASLSVEEKEVYDLLLRWNLYNNVNYKAPSIYERWWENLYNLIWDEFDQDGIEIQKPDKETTIDIMNNYPDDAFIDLQGTTVVETLPEIVQESFSQTVKELNAWKEEHEEEYFWGNYKNTRLSHLLRLEPFSIDKLMVGGGRSIVAANSQNHGQSWKMIVELGDQPKAWAVYPGGQSGNPGSPYYDHMVSNWSSGKYFPLLFMKNKEQIAAGIMFRQSLYPTTDTEK
ncbi:penicillin acylase family protein [Catalinimonas niigatensis]|uniref:penicillin acylase family protein n=1 Tax=Catalinimonas niigatensis TaxID=1397264 RepID=UPI0026664ADD|nr:penicillin acylase family protein [Catalinimonas niigatensis]WPP50663.1 penicillin acylase family protein [Catalinimonas niigatensis]